MLDEATIEARRLAASLRGIDVALAESAHAVLLALASTPDQDTLMGCAATLETIEQRLPPGTLKEITSWQSALIGTPFTTITEQASYR
ncbi:hypothetical protein [Vreelandella zhaodongensis]|uniref:hypothetical protein n=1 Tax=Vreelandella zhaodongensis TaxID=1176240 RepID=UPI003EC03D2D